MELVHLALRDKNLIHKAIVSKFHALNIRGDKMIGNVDQMFAMKMNQICLMDLVKSAQFFRRVDFTYMIINQEWNVTYQHAKKRISFKKMVHVDDVQNTKDQQVMGKLVNNLFVNHSMNTVNMSIMKGNANDAQNMNRQKVIKGCANERNVLKVNT